MANYIKVCPFIAEQLGVAGIRQKTADGNYILWQQDIVAIKGETLDDKSKYLGAVVISSGQGKTELKGTASPIPLLKPADGDLPEEETEIPGEETDTDTEKTPEQASGETENNNKEETIKKRRKSK